MKEKLIKGISTALIVLIVAGGGFWLFKQFTTAGKVSPEDAAAKEEMENRINGQWAGKNDLVCDIWRDENGVFHCSATQTEAEDTVSFWECSGGWSDAAGGFIYADCVRTRYVYDEAGDAEMTVIYDKGRGRFYLKGDSLYWDDDEEDIAKNMKFTYVGEY